MLKSATYDEEGNCLRKEQHDLQTQQKRLSTMHYDESGNCILEEHTVDGDHVYSIQREFTRRGQLEAIIEAVSSNEQQRTSYTYDKQGKLSSVIKPDGCRLDYTYDQEGRLKALTSSDQEISYTYSYDPEGRLILARDQKTGKEVIRCYNKYGKMIQEQLFSGNPFTYLYDDAGRLLEVTFPDGSHLSYIYDNQGLQAIQRKDSQKEVLYTQDFVRNPVTGSIEGIELPCLLGEVRYEMDGLGRKVALSSAFFTHQMQIDPQEPSHLLSEERSDPLGYYQASYKHDAWEQLLEEHFEGVAFQDRIYGYDALGNRILLNANQNTVVSNRLLVRREEASEIKYTYDINGNRLSCQQGEEILLYRYDALNRLIAVENPGQECTTYSYDPCHRRTARVKWSWDAILETWEKKTEEHFLYQGDQEVGSINSDGSTLLRILMPHRFSESGSMVAIEQNGHLYIPIQDLHGSTCLLINAENRQVVEWYRRDAFGRELLYKLDQEANIQVMDASEAINPWRMEGKRYDVESNLVYYGRRFYDPSAGIWLTKDPAGYCDGVQDYLFVKNNPLHRTDLQGLFSFSKLCSTLSDYAYATNDLIHLGAEKVLQSIFATRHIFDGVYRDIRVVTGFCKNFICQQLKAHSFYDTVPYTGVHGEKELSDHIRFSYVNGILNSPQAVLETLYRFSESHGGVRVHYTYRPSMGWNWDLLNAVLVLSGCVSPTAEVIAENWRALIEEMGGLESEGIIIHYAHSLGGAETLCAAQLLTEEERRKIRIFTFGSPVLIPDEGFAGVINYVGRCDLVSLADLYRYAKARFFGEESNIVFVGSSWGIPLLDHYIDHPNFDPVIMGLGRLFTLGVQ